MALTTQFEWRPEASETMPVRRFVQYAGALVVAMGSLGVAGVGCVDPEASFYVRNVTKSDDSCVCTAEGVLLSSGQFESAFGSEYDICLVVTNQLDSLEDRSKPRVETNHIEIYAVDVAIDGDDANLIDTPGCPLSFTYPSKGFASPESDGLVIGLALPQCVASQLYASMLPGQTRTVVVSFIVHGHSTGGDELETPEYSFPVSVGKLAYCYLPDVLPDDELSCGIGSDEPVPSNLCARCRADTDCAEGQTCDVERATCVD